MPRIQVGETLLEVVDCPDCGRTVLVENEPATGWFAKCGRRLINLSECGTVECPTGAETIEEQ